jgi:paraquat-inducible protein B
VQEDYPEPEIKTSTAAYTVWLLPFIALILAMWLIYKNVTEAGINVFITFPDANGIIAKKTPVKFRGIEVGRVQTLTALEDGSGVLANIEMQQSTEAYLTDKLKFWLVKPNVGFSGVTGLDTLLSGAYIQVDGGEEVKQGNSTRYFKALVGAPPVDIPKDLLVYTLVTNNASGVTAGSLIYHRNIMVGGVRDVKLSDDHQAVVVTIAIEPKFAGLVKLQSRFWSVSGVKASFDLSGIKMQTSGFLPMLIGGVAFSSPPKSEPAEELTEFRLYADADSARDSLEINLKFSGDASVKAGSGIYLDQQKVGVIGSLEWDDNFKFLTGKAKLSMDMMSLMRPDTRFWLESPQLSLSNVNVGQLITGTLIRMSPGVKNSQKPVKSFEVLSQSPYKKWAKSGLHLSLSSADSFGIEKGSVIYYKSQVIGEIQWVEFDPATHQFALDALIFPRFREMINDKSLFYNLSGIHFSAQLQGVKMSVPSLKQMVSGGIGVHLGSHLKKRDDSVLAQKSSVVLHKNLDTALGMVSSNELTYYLESKDLLSPALNAGIYYKQFEIGKVSEVILAPQATHSRVKMAIKPRFKSLVRDNSLFWIKPALDISASIAGVKMTAAPLMSMITGGIQISDIDKTVSEAKSGKTFVLHQNRASVDKNTQLITLTIHKDTTLKQGAAVKYRGFTVGEVVQTRLLTDLSGVEAVVDFQKAYLDHFNREDSAYWLVQPKIHLTGIENVAATILGDHLAVDKGTGTVQNHFVVTKSNLPTTKGLAITLKAEQLGSLNLGDPVLYKQMRVGEVTGVALGQNSRKIEVGVVIYPGFRHLVTLDSKFWNVGGIKVDAGLFSGVQIATQTLESIVAGGIAMATSLDGEPASSGQTFDLHDQALERWLSGIINGPGTAH